MKTIKEIDIFGFELPLPFKKDKKFKTFFGSFATIICLIFSIVSFFYFSQNLIYYKNNPKTIEYNNLLKENSKIKMDFKKNNIFLAFSIFSETLSKSFLNESYYTITANVLTKNISIGNFETKKHLKINPCKLEDLPSSKMAYDFYKNKYKSLYCINPDDYNSLSLLGFWSDDYYQYLEINYEKCIESENRTCANQSEINKTLSLIWIEFYFIDMNIDPTNLKNPDQISPIYNPFFLYIDESRNILIEYSNAKIITDSGFLYSHIYEKDYWKIEKISGETHKQNNKYYCKIYIIISKTTKTLKRSYDKIPKIIAEVGGILNIFILFFKIIFDKIYQYLLYKEIINQYYYYEKKEKKSCENGKKIKKKNIKNIKIKKSKNLTIKSNDFQIKSLEINENSDQNINNIQQYSINLINSLKPQIKKLKTSFWQLVKYFMLKRKDNKQKKDILCKAINDFEDKIQFDYITKKFKELDLIKQFIFDRNQLDFLEIIPKYIIFKDLDRNQKELNFSMENILKCQKNISEKLQKNIVDKKILEYFDRFNFK